MSSLYGGQSSDCKHLWGKVMVNRFCTHFQHSLIDQKALEPSNLSLEGSLVLPSPISPGEDPTAPTGLRLGVLGMTILTSEAHIHSGLHRLPTVRQ